MTLDELKQSAREKKSRIEASRIETAEDFELEEIGTIKVAAPLPKAMYTLIVKYGDKLTDPKSLDMSDENSFFRMLLKECVVDPVIDDEFIDLMLSVIGLGIQELVDKCYELLNKSVGSDALEEKIENVEGFTEATPGLSSE